MSHEIKVNGYKPSKWPSRPEMNVDAHEKPAVQQDWEQNDEDRVDYIKNRPFYDATVALPIEFLMESQDFVEYQLQPYVGKEFFDHLADYTVRYAGVDYKFDTARSCHFSGVDFTGVGCHPAKVPGCPPLTSEDVPFTIFRVSPQPGTVLDNQLAFVTIHNIVDGNKDIEIFHTNLKQLDPKFLPPNRFVVNVTSDDNGNLTADKTIAEIIEAYEAGKDVVASPLDAGIEYQLYAISKIELVAVFDVSVPGHNSRGLSITNTGVNLTDSLNIPKIYPVDVELIGQMNVPVGVDNDGKLFSENPTVNVYGSDMKLEVFNHLIAGKTVRCSISKLGDVMLLPYSLTYSGTGYKRYYGIAIAHTSRLELPIRFYSYISENGMDGVKLIINPMNSEIIGTNISGNAVRFCGETISDTTLTEAISIYHSQRPLLTYNHEPFITAELTDSSITIVYMGKGEDGQYGVQKTTFGGITWKSETT